MRTICGLAIPATGQMPALTSRQTSSYTPFDSSSAVVEVSTNRCARLPRPPGRAPPRPRPHGSSVRASGQRLSDDSHQAGRPYRRRFPRGGADAHRPSDDALGHHDRRVLRRTRQRPVRGRSEPDPADRPPRTGGRLGRRRASLPRLRRAAHPSHSRFRRGLLLPENSNTRGIEGCIQCATRPLPSSTRIPAIIARIEPGPPVAAPRVASPRRGGMSR